MIEWISIDEELPKMHIEIDDDGREFETSNLILIWDGYEEQPLGVGVYEDGVFYIEGLGTHKAEYWAYINKPDGDILQQAYSG